MKGLEILPGDAADSDLLEKITRHLLARGLLAYPTETVYGLGAAPDAWGVEAVARLKGRSASVPLLVLLPERGVREAGRSTAWGLRWTRAATDLAEALWPGPLTLVLFDEERRFPAGIRSDEGGVGVRVSPHPFARALLSRWDRPLVSTSANLRGEAPAMTAGEVVDRMAGRPGSSRLLVVDGGRLDPSPHSTLVDCTGTRPRVLREGAIALSRLREIVPEIQTDHE